MRWILRRAKKRGDFLNSIFSKLKNINLSKDKLLLTLLAGVLLVVISLPVKENDSGNAKIIDNEEAVAVSEINNDYQQELEAKIEEVLSAAAGIGEVKVMVTLKNTGTVVLKSETSINNSVITEEDGAGGSRITDEESYEEIVVYTKGSDGSTAPFVVDRLVPEIEGIIIIAEGGDDPQIISDITKAMEAVFGITANKIKVMKMEV